MKDIAANSEDERPERKDERPERKKSSSEGGAFTGIGEWPKKTRSFLEDVRAETRRVSWPNFQQVRSTTIVVLVTVAFFGAYLGLLDIVFTRAISWILTLGK